MTEKIANSENTTRLIPLGRMGEPEEVAHLARFLVDASYITGQVYFHNLLYNQGFIRGGGGVWGGFDPPQDLWGISPH